jgi:PAS domain S-box-containing protein
MSPADPPTGEPAMEVDTDDEPITIYPLVPSSGNQRVLSEWLADHDSYRPADDEPVTEAEFDLCIVDHHALRAHRAELEAVKQAASPVLRPVLLLLPERRSDIIQTDDGEIADNVFTTTVDEIVSLPIRQTELEWRIQALLGLRNQSLAAQRRTRKLRRFREAVEASGHAIFITDADGTIEYVNSAFEEVTGYASEEAIGATPDILNAGEMSSEFFEELWETILAGAVWEDELVNRRKDGSQYTAYQTIAPIPGENGAADAFVAVQTDITGRKELQNRLKRHRDIVQRLEDPIMLQDTSGEFRLVNEAVAEFAGVTAPKLLGEDESLFMDEETAETIARKKADVLETEEPRRYSVSPTFDRTGEEPVFSTSRYPYYDETDELAGTIAICRDVTSLEERTRQLRVVDNILRHNLRNSLTVIHSSAQRVHDQVSGDLAETVGMILKHVDDLESTGEKSRAITKVLSREPAVKSIDIAASLRRVAEKVAADHPEAQIDVTAPDSAVVSATYNIDRVIEELLRNAITHSDRESPAVEVRLAAEDGAVTVRVVDDGPGLTEMDREVLETGRATEELYHGSGLGLWLVYWVVKRSGGSIHVSEVEPRGTRVAITLSQPGR